MSSDKENKSNSTKQTETQMSLATEKHAHLATRGTAASDKNAQEPDAVERAYRTKTFTRRALLVAGSALPFLYTERRTGTAFAQHNDHNDHNDHIDHIDVAHSDAANPVHTDRSARRRRRRRHNDRAHVDAHNDGGGVHNDHTDVHIDHTDHGDTAAAAPHGDMPVTPHLDIAAPPHGDMPVTPHIDVITPSL